MENRPNVVIPLRGGGQADIETDAGTEILAGLGGGLRFLLGNSWFVEPMLRYDFHFADWTVTDRTSGRTGSVGNYGTWTGQIGIGLRF